MPKKPARRKAKQKTPDAPASSRSRTGRPSTLTPEIQNQICSYMAAGNFLDTSCYIVGESIDTVKSWMRQGNKELRSRQRGNAPDESQTAFMLFSLAVKKASAEAEARNLTNINSIARGTPAREITRERILTDGTVERTVEKISAVPAQWTASAWFLERTKWKKFGRKSEPRREAAPPKDGDEPPASGGDGMRPLVVRQRDE